MPKNRKYRVLSRIFETKYKKYLFIFFLFMLYIINSFKLYKKIKVCLCAVGKNENKYIIEFVEHYKKYGIDKIFIYDNNDLDGERFEDILSEYIKIKFIEILNHRGERGIQKKMFQNCYDKNNKKYNWLIFYDFDEFIHLEKYNNIKEFLNSQKFKKCNSIYLNFLMHTDNNLKYYDNRTLAERFTETIKNKKYCIGKSIIKGNLKNIKTSSVHTLGVERGKCNGFGKFILSKRRYCITPDYKYNYIDHYYTKSTEEFINKINRGSGIYGDRELVKYAKINDYFSINKNTIEKINIIAKKTNLNISKIKENIEKKKMYNNLFHIFLPLLFNQSQ